MSGDVVGGTDGVDGGEAGTETTARRASGTWRGKAAVGAVSAVVAMVASVTVFAGLSSAGDTVDFDDVQPGHAFYDDVRAVAASCITGGYPDGGYHPTEPVTRQAMAAFLNRSMGGLFQGADVGPTYPLFGTASSSTYSSTVVISSVTVSVPDLPGNCSVQVHLDGFAALFINGLWGSACHGHPCNAMLELRQGPTLLASSFLRLSGDQDGGNVALDAVTTQADGTTQTYDLVARGFNVKAEAGIVGDDRNIVATVSPR